MSLYLYTVIPFKLGTQKHKFEKTSYLYFLYLGYSLVTLACLSSALGIVFTKKISQKVEKNVIVFYLGLASVVCGSIGLFTLGTPSNPPLWEWGLAVGIAVLGIIQQYMLIYAVSLESPSRVTIVRQSQIVLAYIVQVLVHP